MIELPDIRETFGVPHHISEVITNSLCLSSHDLSKVSGRANRIYIVRYKCLHLLSENFEFFWETVEHISRLFRDDDRFSIADTVVVKSKLDTIGQDKFRVPEVPIELF